MRRVEPRRLRFAVAHVAETVAPASLLSRVQRAWPEAAGAAVARSAEPVSERAGTVTVACESAMWTQELQLLAPELEKRLNQALGPETVARLRFVTRARSRGGGG